MEPMTIYRLLNFSAELSPEANHGNCLHYCQQLHKVAQVISTYRWFHRMALAILFSGRGICTSTCDGYTGAAARSYWNDQLFINIMCQNGAIIIHINKGVIKKQDIPAATRSYPYWVVRYLVDNSLGLWIERNPASRLVQQLTYYVSSPSACRRISTSVVRDQETQYTKKNRI